MKTIIALFHFLCCLPSLAGTTEPAATTLMAGGYEITIQIADTPEIRRQGLSDRIHLPDSCGMLFIFPEAAPRSFWMHRCHFDLDIAYITPDGMVTEILLMRYEPPATPPDRLARYPSRSPRIMYALEMNGGWFSAHGITAGTVLELSRFKAHR